MKLLYKIKVKPISRSEGGGYTAYIPELGEFTLVGDGNTPEEAIKDLNKIKKIMFREWLAQNIHIPKPNIKEE